MDEFLNAVLPDTFPTDGELAHEYLSWEHRQRTCALTWDERFALQRLIVAARPDVRSLVHDFSNYDLVEEAVVLGVAHPAVDRYCPAQAA